MRRTKKTSLHSLTLVRFSFKVILFFRSPFLAVVLIVEFVVHQLLCRRESITVVLGAVMFIGSYPSSFKLLSEFKLQETFPFLNRTWNSNHHLWLPTVPADYRITFQAPGLSCPPLPEVFLVVSICVYSYCWTEQDFFLFSFLMNTSSWVILLLPVVTGGQKQTKPIPD